MNQLAIRFPAEVGKKISNRKYIGCCALNCNRPHHGKGFCATHYESVRRSGRPTFPCGEPVADTTPIASKHELYDTWLNMRRRCTQPSNPEYHLYGGRGITVCDEWRNFWQFVSDMGPRPSTSHSVDRIDNDGPYAAWNCRWATPIEQYLNSRKAKLVEHGGIKRTRVEWARALGISLATFRDRAAKLGWQGAIELGPRRSHKRTNAELKESHGPALP